MDINLIGVPVFYGSDIKGVELGPNKLRESGIKEILEKNNTVYDLGNIYVNKCKMENKYNSNKKAKYLEDIININNNLAHSVYLSLKNGSFPMVLGGDHSLALGSIAGSAKCFGEDLAVIWIDAHGDFNTIDTSLTGNVHGMPLAASAGIGDKSLTNIYFSGNKVKCENIFIIAARDLDIDEEKLIRENKVNIWSTEDVKNIGINKVILDIMKKIQASNINNIHISFDIDSLDAKIMPGTGTKVSNGINIDEVINILQYIFEFKQVRSFDFVEFNPLLDENDITLRNSLILLDKVGRLISEQKRQD